MRKKIKTTQSLAELRDFLRCNKYKVNEKDEDFVNQLIHDWDERVLHKHLIEFHEEELAQQIDAINPNQSKYEICKTIYAIILNQETVINSSTSEERFDYDDWKFNQIWSESDF